MATQTITQITEELYGRPAQADAFQRAVQAEAAKTQAAQPALWQRCEDAVGLIFAGKVQLGTDGTGTVGSRTDPTLTYNINGHCGCKDAQNGAPDGLCAHRLAVGLMKRAQAAQKAAVPVSPGAVGVRWPAGMAGACDPQPTVRSPHRGRTEEGGCEETPVAAEPATRPTPPPAACPEAMFSLTLKGTMDGRDALLTARGATWTEFTAHVQQITRLLDAVPHRDGASAVQQGSAAGARTPGAGGEDWCTIHEATMTWHPGEPTGWWSHKKDDGTYCKGKRPRGRR